MISSPLRSTRDHCGDLDSAIFEQFVKGRLRPPMSVLDAGCGTGRNLMVFLREGFQIYGIDSDPDSVASARQRLLSVSASFNPEHIQRGQIEHIPGAAQRFDVVLCLGVLHLADSAAHAQSMLAELWRVVAPGGMLLIRTGTPFAMETEVTARGNGVYELPDGMTRVLFRIGDANRLTAELGAMLLEPITAQVVPGQRSIMTWVLGRPRNPA